MRMSPIGYERLFSGVPSDFRCRLESRPPCPNVRFPPNCVSFRSESGPGAEGPFSSAFDPLRTLTAVESAAVRKRRSVFAQQPSMYRKPSVFRTSRKTRSVPAHEQEVAVVVAGPQGAGPGSCHPKDRDQLGATEGRARERAADAVAEMDMPCSFFTGY